MVLNRDQVEKVAKLARLSLTAEEAERLAAELTRILDYVEKLEALDVSGVEPTTHAVDVASTPLREDEVRPSLPVEEALANAPAREGKHFSVPRILE